MSKSISSRTSGIALVSVLFIGIMIMILVVTFSFAAMSENRAAGANKTVLTLSELAEATSERARVKIGETFKTEQYTEKGFIDAIRDQLDGGTSVPGLDGNHSNTIAGTNSRWEIRAVSVEDSEVSWVDIAATAENAKGSQTVIQRIGFSPSDIFELAMLTETVNCMICHLRVNGDVGALEHLKPGWTEEGNTDDANAGAFNGGSIIHGNLYAAQTITNDGPTNLNATPANINGALIEGIVEEGSTNRRLPKDIDGDGVADFPPIDREKARNSAKGSLWVNNQVGGAIVKTIGWNQNLNNLGAGSGSLNSVTDGNAILIGTTLNPINLDEDIFVEGDVILKGVVTGQGGIYAGRNIYIAGNLTVQNPPDAPLTGVCATISDPDECAKENIAHEKDTLRLGARGSIIMGDYTEFEARNPRYDYGAWKNGDRKKSDRMPWSRRQNEEFFRSQFGFGWNSKEGRPAVKYYDIGNDNNGTNIAFGDELEWREDLGGYVNVDGEVIPDARVLQVASNDGATSEIDGDDSYDYSFRPGHIETDGTFDSWVSDSMYRSILGTETYDHNSWRRWTTWTNDKNSWKIDKQEFKKNIKYSMQQNGLSITNDNLNTIWNSRLNNRDAHIPIIATNGDEVGIAIWSGDNKGAMLRILITVPGTFETQITEVDAFIYANQRIAGKTSMRPLAINGGMIAKDIGVLAPGRTPNLWPWNLDESTRDCDSSGDTYWVKNTEDCALTLNYDHRLRNGGFGFNLVATDTGKTLSWRLADSVSDRVAK